MYIWKIGATLHDQNMPNCNGTGVLNYEQSFVLLREELGQTRSSSSH